MPYLGPIRRRQFGSRRCARQKAREVESGQQLSCCSARASKLRLELNRHEEEVQRLEVLPATGGLRGIWRAVTGYAGQIAEQLNQARAAADRVRPLFKSMEATVNALLNDPGAIAGRFLESAAEADHKVGDCHAERAELQERLKELDLLAGARQRTELVSHYPDSLEDMANWL